MASMLGLPRELYLMICSLLEPTDLTRLACVSRDHYLAVQHPLFGHIKVYTFDSLVKLLGTMNKVPIVSHISAKQRRYWHKLSHAQLQERDIRSLQIQLDSRKDHCIIGAIVERCVRGIVHKCPDVKIHMTLNSIWRNGMEQLAIASLPNVRSLEVFESGHHMSPPDVGFLGTDMWSLVFSGSTFPDLQEVYLTSYDYTSEVPPTTLDRRSSRFIPAGRLGQTNQAVAPFYGLINMQTIRLEYNHSLTPLVLSSLFNSSIVPKRLTTLEIVDCPRLHPVYDLYAITVLLNRSLQLLRSLKLHLVDGYLPKQGFAVINYDAEIDEHPESHICNIVREAGQKITSLDLALPYACNRMLVPRPKQSVTIREDQQELPAICLEPADTLPQRVIAAGYRYRRLILYRGICRGAYDWDSMISLAVDQRGDVGWELISEPEDRGVWCVGGCAPVERSLEKGMPRSVHDE